VYHYLKLKELSKLNKVYTINGNQIVLDNYMIKLKKITNTVDQSVDITLFVPVVRLLSLIHLYKTTTDLMMNFNLHYSSDNYVYKVTTDEAAHEKRTKTPDNSLVTV
jgi:hypothetical protein